ncbi:MAG: hypothetical protein ABSD92_11050 [Candidatus Bathyarchaeia archaeon]
MKLPPNAFIVVLIISGLMLAGSMHFVGSQIFSGSPTPTPLIPRPSSSPFPGSTPVPQPTSEFPTRTNEIGTISSDTTWTMANGPYNITGSVTVDPGVTLTIEPGAIVNLNSNYLQINGTLSARGTNSDPINFIGGGPISAGVETMLRTDYGSEIVFSPSSTAWNAQAQSGSIIENAVMYSVVINGGSPKITDSSLLNIDIFGGSAEISNNNILGGIGVYSGPTVISNNIISQQTHYFWAVIAQRYDRNNAVIFVGNNASAVISNNIINGFVSQVGCGIGFGTEGSTGTVLVNITNNTIYGFQSGGGTGIAVSAGTGNVTILENTLYDCSFGIGINDTDPLEDGTLTIATTIQGNIIFDDTFGIDLAFPATVENNTISNNLNGILTSVPSTVTYNNLVDNNQSIYLVSSNNLDATNNWWGITDALAINQSIHDSKNDNTLGTVNFVPFLTEQNTQAMLQPNLSTIPTSTPNLTSTPTPTPTSPAKPNQTNTPTPFASQNPTSPPTKGISIYGILIAVLVILIVAFVLVMVVLIVRKSGERVDDS